MLSIRKTAAITALALSAVFASAPAKADLIASKTHQSFVHLNPLGNGLSSVTLSWPLADLTQQKLKAVHAALIAILAAGTESLSPYEAQSFRRLNGINFNVSLESSNLLLTATAPSGNFDIALKHLEHTLKNPSFPTALYHRELVRLEPKIVTKNRVPNEFLATLSLQLALPDTPSDKTLEDLDFSFGRPRLVITRGASEDHKKQAVDLVRALPASAGGMIDNILNKFSFVHVADVPQIRNAKPFTLPKGIIHLADPDASEMMIMLVKAQSFDDEVEQTAAHILMNYIGAHQGSEMFRIIRQELRAAYSPQSAFSPAGKNQAFMSLSATVAAQEWPYILERIKQIYNDTRTGALSETGLKNVHARLMREFNHNFATDTIWSVRNLLREYPDTVKGEIILPLFRAVGTADLQYIAAQAGDALPPIEDYLLILVGGGPAPSAAQRANGYCALPANVPLQHCIQELANSKQ